MGMSDQKGEKLDDEKNHGVQPTGLTILWQGEGVSFATGHRF
jgi:hypothetical protein